MKTHRTLLFSSLCTALLLFSHAAFAVTAGQVDNFEDSTTQGWDSGSPNPVPPENIATGGPAGADDNYLHLQSTGNFGAGGKLVAFNTAQWAGNYVTAGIGSIRMVLKNFGNTDLKMRLRLESPTAAAVSTSAITVPAHSGWITAEFPVTAASLTATLGTVNGAITNTTELRLFHNPSATDRGPNVAASLGVDNITAVGTTATVSGTLTFADAMQNTLTQSVTFTFRPATGSPFDRVVNVPANGVFSISNVPPANYMLHIKGTKYLAVNVAVNTTSGSVSGVNATLKSGDANNDNSIDVLDLDALIQTFDKCSGDDGFVTGPDFNNDGCIDVLDLDILIRYFDLSGAD